MRDFRIPTFIVPEILKFKKVQAPSKYRPPTVWGNGDPNKLAKLGRCDNRKHYPPNDCDANRQVDVTKNLNQF